MEKDLTNRQIGGYRVITRLARGGFSTVWKAKPTGKGKAPVVIKMMLPEKARDRSTRGVFKHEWKICRKLQHPGLITYHEYGEHEDLPYLVMEWFDGKNLKSLVGEKSKLIRARAAEIFRHAAEALGYLHRQGVVHRDVKPENYLVDGEANTRLIDFSIAQTAWQRRLSFGASLTGTPTYMAPELLQGKRARPQSDVYALGAVIFETLTGRPPITGQTQKELLNRHLKGQAPRLAKVDKHVSGPLDKLVSNMLAKDPRARPADAGQVAQRLKSIPIYT